MPEFEFESSSLWQSAVGERKGDRHTAPRTSLKQKILDLRAKVGVLVGQIAKDVPGLTVHDLTHLDALWETASLIAGDRIKLNPAEAYVFGASILLHDARTCLAAYPNGLADLKATTEWRDTVTSILHSSGTEAVTEDMIENPPESVMKAAISEVLRVLHAKRAMDLPFLEWRDENDSTEPILEDADLRAFYGPIIGKIAYSHHIPVGQLETLLGKRLGAHSHLPSDWTVDPISLGCLLRCADAAHIDERRAPRLLRALIRPSGRSADHWNFQSKLAKARLEGDALVYTSGPDFKLDDADPWWLCFDTIRMINRELNEVDVLLENTGLERFAAKRVRGAESPEALCKYVRTQGWVPVDTELRVSDVPGLVGLFGGAHLYGNDLRIPIRELIQNSCDAIRARRLLQDFGEDYGTVSVRVKQTPDGYWLEVEDDGIGMSERTMTGPLLDFGKSFWTSDAIKHEFPGLLAKGMAATGRFGVGFFSVFMLGDVVSVTSCRFDAALNAAKTLEFRWGLESRPILRDAFPPEYLQKGGTRVSVKLKHNPYTENGLLARKIFYPVKSVQPLSLKVILGPLCPNLDVHLDVDEGTGSNRWLVSNDWITMDGKELLARLDRTDEGSERRDLVLYGGQLSLLTDNDQKILGRACIWGTPEYSMESHGYVTVGGLTAARLIGIGGVLLGNVKTIARDSAMPIVPADALSAWATEQAKILSESSLSLADKVNALSFVLRCGGDPLELPIVRRGRSYLNAREFQDILSAEEAINIFEGDEVDYDEDADECHPREFKEQFESDDDIFFVRGRLPTILMIGALRWPECVIELAYPERPKTFLELLRNIVIGVWGEAYDESQAEKTVGKVGYTTIIRGVTTFTRDRLSDDNV